MAHDDKTQPPPEGGKPNDPVLDAHDTEPAGADGVSIKAGHEPDRFKVKNVLYVPALMVTFVLIAFATVFTAFNYLTVKPPIDPAANAQGADDSVKPMDARFAAISSTDPNARVVQPRLEYLKQAGQHRRRADAAVLHFQAPGPGRGGDLGAVPRRPAPAELRGPDIAHQGAGRGRLGERRQVARPHSHRRRDARHVGEKEVRREAGDREVASNHRRPPRPLG